MTAPFHKGTFHMVAPRDDPGALGLFFDKREVTIILSASDK